MKLRDINTSMVSDIPDALRTVYLTGGFWGGVIERACLESLPHIFAQLEMEGSLRNMAIAAGRATGEYSGGYDRDSNVFKVMEGAAYCLMINPDPKLEACLDELIETIAVAQQPNGYLQSYFTSQMPDEIYADLQRSHELYCAGHLMEAAVAYLEATGKRTFLDVAIRLADHVDATFGPGKRETAPGHQEIELALVRLYHVTLEQRYLDLARYFVDARGDRVRVKREYGGLLIVEDDRTPGRNRPPAYRQDHEPMLEQRYATGHAVRAGYLYAAVADIAMAYDSQPHAIAAKAIWQNIVSRKLYLSGGVGTHQYHDEGFGDDYLLPNTGYCETCGGIALLLFSHRMHLLTGESVYADLVETVLLNHVLSSTDLSGCGTFYRNPLSADAPRTRPPWNHPACCPTNVVRILPQFARFMYTSNGDDLYLNQFAGSVANLELDAGSVSIRQETDYPWSGKVLIAVTPAQPLGFALQIRIPGWVAGRSVPSDLYTTEYAGDPATILVSSEPVDTTCRERGYVVIRRTWCAGDVVELEFPMLVRRVHAHPKVEADQGRVALMRGPMLYCFEEMDIGMDPAAFVLSKTTVLKAEHRPDLLGGVTVLTDKAGSLMAVPFNVWNNRVPGRMQVWIKE